MAGRIVERSSGREARVRLVRYPTNQRFLKAMAADDRELDKRPLARLWLEHPLERRWKACTDDPECSDPALFNLALAVRRDIALATSMPTGAWQRERFQRWRSGQEADEGRQTGRRSASAALGAFLSGPAAAAAIAPREEVQ